jgi:hypothetical protein
VYYGAGAHPKTASITAFFKKMFSTYTGKIPNLYIDVRHGREIQDEITGSFMNVATAAVVSIIEKGILAGVFTPEDVPHMTHYTAQIRIYQHAYAKLAEQYPAYGFENIQIVTTDLIQGGQGCCPIVNTVRTDELGFTNNRGRNVVAITRAQDFQLVIDNVQNLGRANTKRLPPVNQFFEMQLHLLPSSF